MGCACVLCLVRPDAFMFLEGLSEGHEKATCSVALTCDDFGRWRTEAMGCHVNKDSDLWSHH